jgi:hypothetical protein
VVCCLLRRKSGECESRKDLIKQERLIEILPYEPGGGFESCRARHSLKRANRLSLFGAVPPRQRRLPEPRRWTTLPSSSETLKSAVVS